MNLPEEYLAEDFGRVFELVARQEDKDIDQLYLSADVSQVLYNYVEFKGYSEPEVNEMFYIAREEHARLIGMLATLTPEDIIENRF